MDALPLILSDSLRLRVIDVDFWSFPSKLLPSTCDDILNFGISDVKIVVTLLREALLVFTLNCAAIVVVVVVCSKLHTSIW